MSGGRGQDRGAIAVSLAAALLVHGALAGGLGAAEHFGWNRPTHRAEAVEMVIVAKPPPPPPPPEVPKVEEPPPPPPPVAAPVPVPVPVKAPPPKVAPRTPAPPKAPPPEAPPPAPGPEVDDSAAPEIKLDIPASAQGTMTAPQGTSATGVPGGKRGGTGQGPGGGGAADADGSGPRVASVASVKTMPVVEGDFDHVLLGKDYPADAKRLGIEGQVQVRLLIDDHGRVAQTKLLKGLGYGLDERAVALARKIRFKPAVDTNDAPVATWITWSFNFELPE
jgi:protein TonB